MDVKTCPRCGETKSTLQFSKNKARKDGLDTYCKECNAEYYREYKRDYRKRNKGYFKEYQANHRDEYYATNKRYRDSRGDLINSLKTDCVKCGESRRYVIQWHHINPMEKTLSISNGAISKKKAIAEIAKCVCLCANCHAEFHHIYGNRPSDPEKALKEYLGEDIYEDS